LRENGNFRWCRSGLETLEDEGEGEGENIGLPGSEPEKGVVAPDCEDIIELSAVLHNASSSPLATSADDEAFDDFLAFSFNKSFLASRRVGLAPSRSIEEAGERGKPLNPGGLVTSTSTAAGVISSSVVASRDAKVAGAEILGATIDDGAANLNGEGGIEPTGNTGNTKLGFRTCVVVATSSVVSAFGCNSKPLDDNCESTSTASSFSFSASTLLTGRMASTLRGECAVM
jgi:hypothetical protein